MAQWVEHFFSSLMARVQIPGVVDADSKQTTHSDRR